MQLCYLALAGHELLTQERDFCTQVGNLIRRLGGYVMPYGICGRCSRAGCGRCIIGKGDVPLTVIALARLDTTTMYPATHCGYAHTESVSGLRDGVFRHLLHPYCIALWLPYGCPTARCGNESMRGAVHIARDWNRPHDALHAYRQ